MSDIEVYLDKWMQKERNSYTKYDDYLKKYNESHDLLSKVPSPEEFINKILEFLKYTANAHQVSDSDLTDIFSQKSATSWEAGKKGKDRI